MQKPLIPKEPIVPNLTENQIERLTQITFLDYIEPKPCDAIFIFGGTHPGHWEKAIEAYRHGLSNRIVVTGGVSPTGVKHLDWNDPSTPEADVIINELVKAGINRESISYENRSRNTLENVLFAMEAFDFSGINSLLYVCKNHCAGRQYRTLAQHIKGPITYIPFGFDTIYNQEPVSRYNWMNTEQGRARVYGEFLRINYLGTIGHILPLEEQVNGLEDKVSKLIEN